MKFRTAGWVFAAMLTLSVAGATQAQDQSGAVFMRFAILALTDEDDVRHQIEDQLVTTLRAGNYDAVASYTLMPDLDSFQNGSARVQLMGQGIQAALVMRPVDVSLNSPEASARLRLAPEEVNSLTRFIQAYRGDDFSLGTIVQMAGFLLDSRQSNLFWHGVIWLDNPAETQQDYIDKIVDLAEFNLNQSRGAIRQQLGYPPLRQ